jgi:NADH:ubiquinone oxidoreductase subunit F (NADH-binding)
VDTPRVLDAEAVTTLDAYRANGGGAGIDAASRLGGAATIDELTASGLRGRGGAGFPTGRKWQTVCDYESPDTAPQVVVNAAEGEPGSFKDRTLLRTNPFRVLEGAAIAARTIGADEIVFAVKHTFAPEIAAVEGAIAQAKAAGWLDGIDAKVAVGPSEYLFGEETALLEVLDGRDPFPRVAPPYRHGIVEFGDDAGESAARLEMSARDGDSEAPPALVSNTETFANVPNILALGADWFRELGTADSPGTIVCTVTGSTVRHGVAEFPMGTPLAEVIDAIGGGVGPGRRVAAVMSGVANALLPGDKLATPCTYEDMQAAGAGLGAAGFIVFDDSVDLLAVAHGVSRFLSVESCGQCVPCKIDGLKIEEMLGKLLRHEAHPNDVETLQRRLTTVADSARCNLATQQQLVIGSVLELFPAALEAHAEIGGHASAPYLVAPIVDIAGGRAVLDTEHDKKQPDWTYDTPYSGKTPADRIDERAHHHEHEF